MSSTVRELPTVCAAPKTDGDQVTEQSAPLQPLMVAAAVRTDLVDEQAGSQLLPKEPYADQSPAFQNSDTPGTPSGVSGTHKLSPMASSSPHLSQEALPSTTPGVPSPALDLTITHPHHSSAVPGSSPADDQAVQFADVPITPAAPGYRYGQNNCRLETPSPGVTSGAA
eukprot:gene10330-9118_t